MIDAANSLPKYGSRMRDALTSPKTVRTLVATKSETNTMNSTHAILFLVSCGNAISHSTSNPGPSTRLPSLAYMRQRSLQDKFNLGESSGVKLQARLLLSSSLSVKDK